MQEQVAAEPVPLITNIFDKNVVPKVLEANAFLEKNDEEGAKRVICDMIRAGYVQVIPLSEIRSGLVADDRKMQ